MIFKRNNKKPLIPNQDALAHKIAAKIIKAQWQLAKFLNSKTANFSKVQKELLLLGISIAFGVASLYLIFSAIN